MDGGRALNPFKCQVLQWGGQEKEEIRGAEEGCWSKDWFLFVKEPDGHYVLKLVCLHIAGEEVVSEKI